MCAASLLLLLPSSMMFVGMSDTPSALATALARLERPLIKRACGAANEASWWATSSGTPSE